jgi:putative Mn2+ efflux pump MntP
VSFPVVLGIAFGLAMDAFAVTLGLGCSRRGLTRGQAFRLAFHFGLFQFVMPIIGWAGGTSVERHIRSCDHWIAFGLLAFVGGKMIVESFRSESEDARPAGDPTRGHRLLLLSVATSIDALAVGLSLAVLEVRIFYPAAVIGVVAFGMTVLGARLGPVLGRLAGRRAELAGGLVLIGIGIKIVIDHLV